jgi:hypothetical protein
MFEPMAAYVRALAHRRRIRAELEEELRFHRDQQIEAYISLGMSFKDAVRRAHVELGASIRLERQSGTCGRFGLIRSGAICNLQCDSSRNNQSLR